MHPIPILSPKKMQDRAQSIEFADLSDVLALALAPTSTIQATASAKEK